MELREVDEVGRVTSVYVSSKSPDASSGRVDLIGQPNEAPLGQRLLSVFLPSGYPLTVSPDYAPYQIYDSLQAFASSIAGLLASRAVLQSIGVGDENASATAALILRVLQESVGRLATILFAHYGGRSIEAECKMYRLAADIFNDIAMVLDCLSPSFPESIRVPLFCASSVFRTLCGVAGGSSKASLSSHFAQADNIGELNAKDSSQETVISLLGMWAGSLVVANVTTPLATWLWLLSLLTVHLCTNYAAVASVHLRTLNRQRANVAFSHLMADDRVLGPDEVARQEFIFETDGVLRWKAGEVIGRCQIGVSLAQFMQRLGGKQSPRTQSFSGLSVPLEDLLAVFARHEYVLWFDRPAQTACILLKEGATTQSQLRAWSHALRTAHHLASSSAGHEAGGATGLLQVLDGTLREHDRVFDDYVGRLEKRGWNTVTGALETRAGRRVRM